MSRSQKILTASFLAFALSLASFHLWLSGSGLGLLLLNLVLGFVTSASSRRAGFRYIGWFGAPLLVALVVCDPRALFGDSDKYQSMAWLLFAYLTGLGLMASGVGALLGYFLRRSIHAA